jgi:hypothetical protein
VNQGRVIALAISDWLPTATATVQASFRSSVTCGGQSGIGAGSLRVLRFPLTVIHSTNCFTTITIYHPGLVK